MKTTKLLKTFLFTAGLFFSALSFAQTEKPEQTTADLPQIALGKDISLHIISPEPIQFVDLSSDYLVGDMPAANIARVKIRPVTDSVRLSKHLPEIPYDLGIVTVVGQSFMAQYKLIYGNPTLYNSVTNLQIQPEQMQPLDYPTAELSNTQLWRLSQRILNKKNHKPIRSKTDLGLTASLNNVYVMDDYIFLDISYKNKTNLSYNIDNTRFSVEDKKVYKATNTQTIPLKPVFQLYSNQTFRKDFRNIYVFKKFTYPNSKILLIQMAEQQLSGRSIDLKIKYSDILKADTF